MVRQILESIDEIENRVKKVEKNINELKSTVEGRLDSIELKLNKNESEVNNIVEDKIKSTITNNSKYNDENLKRVKSLEKKILLQNEVTEKEKRLKNIVLFNIPESLSELPKERIAEDCNKLRDIFAKNNLVLNTDKIENIFRLGKRDLSNVKPRPVLLKFNTVEYKKEVIRFCKYMNYIKDNLKIPIYYSDDLTLQERNERKALLQELKRRKDENNEKDLGIRGGKIVKILKPFPREAQPSLRKSWADLFKQ